MTTNVVKDDPRIIFQRRIHDLERRFLDGSVNRKGVLDGLQFLLEGKRVQPIVFTPPPPEKNLPQIFQEILTRNASCLLKFGLRKFDLSQSFFRNFLGNMGEDRVRHWQEMGLEPVYWPRVVLSEKAGFEGWAIKPEEKYFQMARKGQIFWPDHFGNKLERIKQPYALKAGAYLVDSRCRPTWVEGKVLPAQEDWGNDYLASFLEKLRKKVYLCEEFPSDVPLASRSLISADQAQEFLYPSLQESEHFRMTEEIRDETGAEYNFISQCFRFMPRYLKDGEGSPCVWLHDRFTHPDLPCELRFVGGGKASGGLASVRAHAPDYTADAVYIHLAVRPIMVMALE